mgnify:FL=1
MMTQKEKVARAEFVQMLSEQIQKDLQAAPRRQVEGYNEPYRAFGDKLVDDALALIP